VLTLLGVLRAGLIAMPLPLLWRRAEAVAALSRVGVHALIVSGRIGQHDHYDLAMQIAAEIFPVRYVCGYGADAPDGVISFDDLFDAESLNPLPPLDAERAGDPGGHVAVITWDVWPDGLVPVARTHSELIAGGLAMVLEGKLPQDVAMLSPLAMSSFASLAIAMTPWLLLGGTLTLHHPFDTEVVAEQLQAGRFDTIIVPGPLAVPLAESGHLAAEGLSSVIGVWRAPERLSRALASREQNWREQNWREATTRLIDVQVFGEIGFIPAARGVGGRPVPTPFGVVFAPRGAKGTVVAAEIAPTATGTLAMRGPMVPRGTFPPGAERSHLPYFKVAANGFVDTGYACHPGNANLVLTGAPPGVVGVGGYRFLLHELQEVVGAVESGPARLAAASDPLTGQRLDGTAADCRAVEASLRKRGVNPLLADAFGERHAEDRRQSA